MGHANSLEWRCSHLCSSFVRVRNHNNRYKTSCCLLLELENADALVRKLHGILLVEKEQKAIKDHGEVKELLDTLEKCVAHFDEGIVEVDSKSRNCIILLLDFSI